MTRVRIDPVGSALMHAAAAASRSSNEVATEVAGKALVSAVVGNIDFSMGNLPGDNEVEDDEGVPRPCGSKQLLS